jgi:hypothetical protein
MSLPEDARREWPEFPMGAVGGMIEFLNPFFAVSEQKWPVSCQTV